MRAPTRRRSRRRQRRGEPHTEHGLKYPCPALSEVTIPVATEEEANQAEQSFNNNPDMNAEFTAAGFSGKTII